MVDFAAMRDAVKRLGGEPDKINPLCPVDLVIDHSVQVDVSRRYCIIILYLIPWIFLFLVGKKKLEMQKFCNNLNSMFVYKKVWWVNDPFLRDQLLCRQDCISAAEYLKWQSRGPTVHALWYLQVSSHRKYLCHSTETALFF